MQVRTQDKKKYCYAYPRPAVTVDIVVFCVCEGVLEILLIRRGHDPFAGRWALPGGFVEIDESLQTAAQRELLEETGLKAVYLEQLYSFGQPDRDPRGRTITVAYYALTPASKRDAISPGDDAAEVQWFAAQKLPRLAFDHRDIISCAVNRLQGKVCYATAAFELMPREFTLSQVQQVYEAIWQKRLDRRNFRKWICNVAGLADTGRLRKDGAHRPGRLYRFRKSRHHNFPLRQFGFGR